MKYVEGWSKPYSTIDIEAAGWLTACVLAIKIMNTCFDSCIKNKESLSIWIRLMNDYVMEFMDESHLEAKLKQQIGVMCELR